MTRQTPAPLDRLPINTFNRSAIDLAREVRDGIIELNPPYLRDELEAIANLAYRGSGDGATDALAEIHRRAREALRKEG